MSHFSRWMRQRLPGPITLGIVWLNRTLVPDRDHRREARLWRQWGGPRRVLQGPFEGQYCGRHAAGSEVLYKMLGTYEMELNEAVEDLIGRQPDLVINVGTAEGYYTVGLARRLTSTSSPFFSGETARWVVQRAVNGKLKMSWRQQNQPAARSSGP